MTPWDLQKSLIAEIEELLAQMQLKNAAGEDVVGVKGYEQRLPEITDDEEDHSSPEHLRDFSHSAEQF